MITTKADRNLGNDTRNLRRHAVQLFIFHYLYFFSTMFLRYYFATFTWVKRGETGEITTRLFFILFILLFSFQPWNCSCLLDLGKLKIVVAGTTFDTNLLSSIPKDVAIALPFFPPFAAHGFCKRNFFFYPLCSLYTHIPILLFLIIVTLSVTDARVGDTTSACYMCFTPFFQPSFSCFLVSYFRMKACSALVLCVMRTSFSSMHMM